MSFNPIGLGDNLGDNLARLARIPIILAPFGAILFFFRGTSTQNLFSFIIAGTFYIIATISQTIIRTRDEENPAIGVWHLMAAIILTGLLISATQANVGSEVGLAILIIILVIGIQCLPTNLVIRSLVIALAISLISGILAFYSPILQTGDAIGEAVIIWAARGTTVIFLVQAIYQFAELRLASKVLITILAVVVLISTTFNIVMVTLTSRTLTNQVGEQLHALVESRGKAVGDLLSNQVQSLKSLALNDTLQVAIDQKNVTYSDNEAENLNNIQKIDQEYQAAIVDLSTTNRILNLLSNNAVAQNLERYRAIFPNNIDTLVTDKKGALVGANNVPPVYYHAEELWWQSAYNDGKGGVYIGSPVLDENTNNHIILIAVPILDETNSEVNGILKTTISLKKLIQSTLGEELIDDPAMLDIIFTGEQNLEFQTNTGQLEIVSPVVITHIVELQESNQVYDIREFQGEENIFSTAKVTTVADVPEVNDLNWFTIIHLNKDEALIPVRQQVRLTSFIGTIIVGIATLLSFLVAQVLANPILNLTETANEVSGGNLSARAVIESNDEIGQLASAFNIMNTKLQDNLSELEQRVADRTEELEISASQIETRAGQFKTVAQLARTIATVQQLDTLLPKTVDLVSKEFGFYQVGLFLLDESGEYAVLNAASSEGGKKMLERKHRLKVEQTSIVGYVTSTGEARIALDTGYDAIHFDNPELPDTRSEMALPLLVGSKIIGALDVQSLEADAFTEEDIEVLSILADEISVAIENARLFEVSQRLLTDAQTVVAEYTLEAWQKIAGKRKVVGYELSGTTVRSLDTPTKSNDSTQALAIKLRDQLIGSININLPGNRKLNQDETEILEVLAERVGTAIENATLLEETTRRALKENVVSEITAKIGSSINLRNVLETAVEELGRGIPGSEIIIQFNSDSNGTNKAEEQI